MAKSFTINTSKYQAAQKKFYAYNVANDKSVLNTSNIKSATFNFHFTNKNMILIQDGSDENARGIYKLDDENTAILISLQNFYLNNYGKIIDMSANGDYNFDLKLSSGENSSIIMSASNIFSKNVNAYKLDMTVGSDIITNVFILTINAAAKAFPMAIAEKISGENTELALMDDFTFGLIPTHFIDESEEDESKLTGLFMIYGFPYFLGPSSKPDEDISGIANSNIAVNMLYMGDDE